VISKYRKFLKNAIPMVLSIYGKNTKVDAETIPLKMAKTKLLMHKNGRAQSIIVPKVKYLDLRQQ
jgi:hypothetical protein